MTTLVGQTVSHYTILEKLGEGGMGVVYKAEDTRLNRAVALKFLHRHLSATEQDKARFLQEARTAATLSHANICVIHDIQEHEGQLFLVMDFVEGEGLKRLRGKLTLKQILQIGTQVAEGLGAAHDKGIVHRDIKPENVMVRNDGTVQILDFGLARLRGTSRLTKEGTTLGTIGYMSPEQVQGLDVDHRSDIFSFGVMMYELLTGLSPFRAEHETALIYEILNYDPPAPSDFRRDIDPELSKIVMGCLEKDRNDRIQSMKEVARELRQFQRTSDRRITTQKVSSRAAATPVPAGVAGEVRSASRVARIAKSPFLAWTCTGLLAVALALVVRDRLTQRPSQLQLVQARIPIPQNSIVAQYMGGGHFAVSPDGSTLAFVAADSSGVNVIWLQSLRDGRVTRLVETEAPWHPFWSPDGRSLGFFQGGRLKRIPASGGVSYDIAEAPDPRGGAWSKNDTIIYSPQMRGPIFKVSARGGSRQRVTAIDSASGGSHRWPAFLGDGRHFLFFARSASRMWDPAKDSIFVGSLDASIQKAVTQAQSDVQCAGEYVLFMRGSAIMAQVFNVNSCELEGESVPVADDAGYNARFSKSHFTVSQNGILVHQSHTPLRTEMELFLGDPTLKKRQRVGAYEVYVNARFSPDGRKIALDLIDLTTRNVDIWITDLSTMARNRLTFDLSNDQTPVWSPDGKRIAFVRETGGRLHLLLKNADGSGSEQLLYDSAGDILPTDWSPDGEFILATIGTKLWAIPLHGEGKAFPLEETGLNGFDGRFATNGKWIAYCSDETGRNEIYVRPFPGPGSKWQVTSEGGDYPRWQQAGRELLYVNKNAIMSARIEFGTASLKIVGTRQIGSFAGERVDLLFDISRSGDKLLEGMRTDLATEEPFTILMNWQERLRR